MIGTLRAYLAKERRDGRALLIGIPAALTVVLVVGSFLVPDRFLRDAFFPQIAALAGVVLGLLAIAADVVPGEARRGRMAFLGRLPGGLGTAWVAKTIHVVLALAFLGVFGFAAGKLVAAAWGVPFAGDLDHWPAAPWTWFWQSGWGPAIVATVAAGGWVLTVSTWLPRGSLALPAAGLALGAFGLPLWLLYRLAPGLVPYDGFVVFYGAALAVAPFAIGGISFVRGRRHGRGPLGSAWRGLLATAVLFAPAWAFAASEVRDWLTVDPESDRCRIAGGYVGEGGRMLYLNVSMVQRLRSAEGFERTGPNFPIQVDLESAEWEQVGEAGDRFELAYDEQYQPVRLITVVDASASVHSTRGWEIWRRFLDGRTGELVKSGWDHIRHPELDAHRPERPAEAPEGFSVGGRCGLGRRLYRDRTRWYWDPLREKCYPASDFEGFFTVLIRPGRWLAWPGGGGWVLLDPESRETTPLPSPEGAHVWAVIPDGRALVTVRGVEWGIYRTRLVDPETMEGRDLDPDATNLGYLGSTSDGGAMLLLTRETDDPTRPLRRIVRLDGETGEIVAFGGWTDPRELWPIAMTDADTLIATHEGRRVVRIRRGSDAMEVLWPRGVDG